MFVAKPVGGGGETELDRLLIAIGSVLAPDTTLGGLAENLVCSAPIVLNGVTWTFAAGTPSGSQTQIGASLDATLTALAADLNASADAQVAKCTYSANTTLDRLEVQFDTAGVAGNAFTLSASANSNGTTSGPTLTGGGYQHVWTSGNDAIPSYTVEVGHPKLAVPVFFRHLGTVMESLAFQLGQQGPANAKVQLVAQGEEQAPASIDASPSAYSLKRFTQARGYVRKGGAALAGITGGSLSFSNNLERVRVIRDDGKIAAADPTIATCTGTLKARFDGGTLLAEAASGEPVAIAYGFTMAEGWVLSFELFRTFLPKPKYSIAGPGGVEASFDWRAAFDEASGTMLRASLLNDVASY